MCLECSPLSGLEARQSAVLELVDRVHVGQDRAVVRHHDGALVRGLDFLADQLRDLLAVIRIQARCRLVGQNQLRIADEGARDGRALLLPARHLARVLAIRILDAQVCHEGKHLRVALLPVLLALELGNQFKLVADPHVGQQLVILEDEAEELQTLARPLPLAQLGEVLACDGDASLVGREQRDIGGQEKLSGNVVPPHRAFFRWMTIHDGGLPVPRRLGECTVSVADSLNTWWNDAT